MTRQRPPERVEMITGDPRAFGVAPVPSSAPSPSPTGRSRTWMVFGAAAVVALVVALVWPHDEHHPIATATTTTQAIAVTAPTTAVPTTLPGRDAPLPAAESFVGMSITPNTAVLGRPVSVRLSGSLDTTSPTLAAIVWLDHFTSGRWRSVAWIAQVGNGRQVANRVAVDGSGPAPDAIFLPPDQPFNVNVDAFESGLYRLCRYVTVHSSSSSDTSSDTTVPHDGTAYVCGELTVDHP